MNKGAIATAILIAAGYVNPARGQASATTLVVGLENVVEYQVDFSDLSKWGTNPNITQGGIGQGKGVGCVGVPLVVYGDIVSVNGDPARGTYVSRGLSVCLSPTPTAGLSAMGVYSLAIDPQDTNTLYAAAYGSGPGGIFKSTDCGANWSASVSPGPIGTLAIDPLNPNALYVAGDGLFKSTDGTGHALCVTCGLQHSFMHESSGAPTAEQAGTR